MKKLYPLAILITVVCCSFYGNSPIKLRTGAAHLILKNILVDTPASLPRSYAARKFMNDLATNISTDISDIPGNIVSYNAKDTSYSFRTAKGITKDGKPAVGRTINDGLIYSAIVTPQTSFNGSYLIGGFAAGINEIMEISIRDEAVYSVPDSLIDFDAIRNATKNMSADERKNLYYVKAATLTSINAKKYTLSKFNPAINSFYITLGGKVYATREKTRSEKVVSVFLIPVQRIYDAGGNK